MGSNYRRNRAIEHTPHGDLLRSRLTMEIDEDHFGGRSQPGHLGLGEQERVFHGRHERPRLKVQHGHWGQTGFVPDNRSIARHARRIIGRPQHPGLGREERSRLLLIPDMIPGRDNIHAVAEQFPGDACGNAIAPSAVLTIGDDKIDSLAVHQVFQEHSDCAPTGFAHDIP